MLTEQEFLEQWGNGELLCRYDSLIVQSLPLPQATKDFLIQIGMFTSRRNHFPITHIYPDLPPLQFVCDKEDLPEECRHLRVFSTYAPDQRIFTFHCLEELTGYVYSFSCDSLFGYSREKALLGYSRGFCNSSIKQFAQFILILQNYENWLNTIPCSYDARIFNNPIVMKQADQTYDDLRACDLQACYATDYWLQTESLYEEEPLHKFSWTDLMIRMLNWAHWDVMPPYEGEEAEE